MQLFFLIVFGIVLAVLFYKWYSTRDNWRGSEPHSEPLTYLNGAMGSRPTVLGHSVPEGYRNACSFFGVGLIDRTGTLDQGFPIEIIDPIPTDFAAVAPLETLCAERAEALIAEAGERGIKLRLFWSGGIDSTCVAVVLLNALGDDTSLLEVAYSDESQAEYPLFHDLLIKLGVKMIKITSTLDAMTASALNVTGEHGDQLFGSMLLGDLDEADYFKPWSDVIPVLVKAKLPAKGAEAMMAYLAPQTAACPIPVETAFDWLWWANFSMKWQAVSERMLAPMTQEGRDRVAPLMRHFFRTDDFQRWALANPDKKIHRTWASYKYALKAIIHEMTGDAVYRDTKEKERSLRLLVAGTGKGKPMAITLGGLVMLQAFGPSLFTDGSGWSSGHGE